jgi:hypothetical protein
MAMKLSKNLGMTLLGIWLIATGVLHFVPINSSIVGVVMAILAIAAGLLILLGK